ncbi:MAG TPA: 50S ribosomal protein L4 [Candidatus Nanoarchaeia archaeon]|nr:50S ribosomal protein L4 [Candidatus Nanoarchaeia archaeon]
MKSTLYDSKGSKKSEIELPEIFSTPLRQDLVMKYAEAEKYSNRHRYGSYAEAGKRHSASGTISHRRHEWKGHYGKGISRVPRKAMWRRGTQFYWVGAEVSNTRGGRRAHPPKGQWPERKINSKEKGLAWRSALAATADKDRMRARYASLGPSINATLPAVIESLPKKAKEIHAAVAAIFGTMASLATKEKQVRAGKGKRRNRKYKENAGVLIITSAHEKNTCASLEIKQVSELEIGDFYPLGRLALYTQKSLEEVQALGGKK